jgi:hypothetical protein
MYRISAQRAMAITLVLVRTQTTMTKFHRSLFTNLIWCLIALEVPAVGKEMLWILPSNLETTRNHSIAGKVLHPIQVQIDQI